MDPKTLLVRRAVVHMAELAMRMEHESISQEDRAAMEKAAQLLDRNRQRVEWKQTQGLVTFLVESVLAPLYRYVQEHPQMTVEEIEARLVEESRRSGFNLEREVLDDLVLLPDEINGAGAVKAATEAVGAALQRTGRSIMTWMSESQGFPPNMSARSGTRAANVLVYVAGLLRIEAAEDGSEKLVERLSAVIDAIIGQPDVAPPPNPATSPLVPPSDTVPD